MCPKIWHKKENTMWKVQINSIKVQSLQKAEKKENYLSVRCVLINCFLIKETSCLGAIMKINFNEWNNEDFLDKRDGHDHVSLAIIRRGCQPQPSIQLTPYYISSLHVCTVARLNVQYLHIWVLISIQLSHHCWHMKDKNK